tara:strand:+ start:13237 stop:13935 length:699 start_codon:yes stop_codon:yes gene_type:complete
MDKLVNNYERDGYIILKKCISKKECNIFLKTEIDKQIKKEKIIAKNKKTFRNRKELIISNKDLSCPLSKKYVNWATFFNNTMLHDFLNKIHRNRWKFSSSDLGWIHFRFPFYKSLKLVPCNNWHLDGMKNSKFINYNQGEIILPMITKVSKFGGGTIIVKDSHKHINNYIHSCKKCDIFTKINELSNKLEKIEILGDEGDILIMNPFLIHGSSFCNKKNRIRVLFNTCIEYK